MKPGPFAYHKAESVNDAIRLLAEHGEEASILAGGQSLIANLNQRRVSPRLLIDVGGLGDLRQIEMTNNILRIGAGVRHAELGDSELVAQHAPLLIEAVRHLGHTAVRNRGTIGGNIVYADPASELPACCMAADATFELAGPAGRREVSARTFFTGAFETTKNADELLTEIRMPVELESTRTCFREFARRRGGYALLGVAIYSEWTEQQISSLSPVFFGLGGAPQLASDAAALLTNVQVSDEAISAAADALGNELETVTDAQAGAAYRMHLAQHYFAEGLRGLRDGA